MATKYKNITIQRGTTFELILTTGKDLTGLTPKCEIKRSYFTQNSITINSEVNGDPVNGEIRLFLSLAESSAIDIARYVYDVVLYNIDNTLVSREYEGTCEISPNVTVVT